MSGFTVRIMGEYGIVFALDGLSLSYGRDDYDYSDWYNVALKLAELGGSHAKFMESISVWLDINAPRYWWQQFDTYRVGVSKQSASTMHTILNRRLRQDDFESAIPQLFIDEINSLIDRRDFAAVKRILPESFMQRRIVCLNYKVIAHIITQRLSHRLQIWKEFCAAMRDLDNYELISAYIGEGYGVDEQDVRGEGQPRF